MFKIGKIPQNTLCQLLASLDGTVGLYIHDLDSGEMFQINPDQVFPSASVIKIPLLALLLRDVQEGRVDWHAKRPIASCNRVGGTGILCELEADYTPTVETLAKLMIVISDNTATNEIIDLLGIDRINCFCQEMGCPNTVLMRKMLDFEAIRQEKNNYMCAGEVGRLLV